MTTRICLWSSPRNVSTAFMYSFAQRKDTTVVDEPLYGFYLKESNANHPGKDEIIGTMECDADRVINKILLAIYSTPIAFFKHMTHHMVGNISYNFMSKMFNLFFIRDPKLILNSYAKVIEKPTLYDIGIELQIKYLNIAIENNYPFAVLDSADLLKNPEQTIKKLCEIIGIPFDKNMLAWKSGAIKEDGIWAKYWYNNVHQSKGFEKYQEQNFKLPENLQTVYQQAKPHYDFLKQHAIKF